MFQHKQLRGTYRRETLKTPRQPCSPMGSKQNVPEEGLMHGKKEEMLEFYSNVQRCWVSRSDLK